MAAGRLTPRFRSSHLIAGLLAAFWAASLIPLASVGAANERLVEAFATDEAMQLNLLRAAAAKQTFALTFGPYGHLVFNMILVILRVLPGELSDARIVHTGRTISVVFAAAMMWLTFVWTRRAFGDGAAWVAFAALLLNKTLYAWAVVLKPDMPQLFFLMLALALAWRLAGEPRLRWLVLASMAAGLAFACKYSGLFVLPIIGVVSAWRPIRPDRAANRVSTLRWLTAAKSIALLAASRFIDAGWIASHLTEDGRIDAPISHRALMLLAWAARGGALAAALVALTPRVWSALRRRPRVAAALWSWTIAAAVFAATFALASPYSLRRAAFAKALFVEASNAAAPLTADWLSMWFDAVAVAVGWPVLVASLATMAGCAWLAVRHRSRDCPAGWILTVWVVLYALVLSAPLHEFYVHYALPLAAPTAMLAAFGLSSAAGWFERTFNRQRLATVLLSAVVIAAVVSSVPGLLATRDRLRTRESASAAVFVGTWLGCRAPGSARVAYDYFSYVPPAFREASPTWGGTPEWLSRVDPDIVIVNNATAALATDSADHAAYYRCLSDGTCGYERVFSRGELTLYARSGQAATLRASAPRAAPGCDAGAVAE